MPESSKKILIIDDQPDICAVMNTHFKAAGLEFKQAYDGVRGLELAVGENIDCILLDVRMPREDGLTFLRKLRGYRDDDPDKQRRVRSVPVIVLTAAGENMRLLFENEGVSEYISKPFDLEKVKDAILSALQSRS